MSDNKAADGRPKKHSVHLSDMVGTFNPFCVDCKEMVKASFGHVMPTEYDPVNHPKHYTSDPSGVECITITRHRNFNIGNAMKYLWRAGLKDSAPTEQDLDKAIWYIQDEKARLFGNKVVLCYYCKKPITEALAVEDIGLPFHATCNRKWKAEQ